ncbi:MAG: CPBP family intramembrane metalloprotease [Propionibacteriaceae bacterium]|jgi:membrane protease YdiL (CAAX protease family)|nr:CPBP family intramembrane metalloprotease [Propionibacteriaceae bacterium]
MPFVRWFTDPVAVLRADDGLPPDHPAKPWPNPHRVRTNPAIRGLAFIVAAVALYTVAVAVYHGVTAQAQPGFYVDRAMTLGAFAAAYLVVVMVTEQRVPPFELAPRRWTGLAGGLAFGAAAVLLTVGLLALVGAYRVTGFNAAYSPWAALLSAGLVAAVAEEMIFRGMAFRLLEDAFGTWWAVAAVSVSFGAAHLANPDATLLGALGVAVEGGLVTTAVYVLNRSLWWCVGEHFAWNIVQGPILGSPISGTGSAEGWLTAQFSGPDWLTGGIFGIEASIVPIALLTPIGVVLLAAARRQGRIVAPWWRRRATGADQVGSETAKL